MANNKVKTNKAVAKRVKVTGRGKLMRFPTASGHLKSRKSPSRLRRFRKEGQIAAGFVRQAKRLLGI